MLRGPAACPNSTATLRLPQGHTAAAAWPPGGQRCREHSLAALSRRLAAPEPFPQLEAAAPTCACGLAQPTSLRLQDLCLPEPHENGNAGSSRRLQTCHPSTAEHLHLEQAPKNTRHRTAVCSDAASFNGGMSAAAQTPRAGPARKKPRVCRGHNAGMSPGSMRAQSSARIYL